MLVQLTALRAEFEYAISDATELPKSLAERAFLHLNRQIVADAAVRTAWNEAFTAGETTCEQLGGTVRSTGSK